MFGQRPLNLLILKYTYCEKAEDNHDTLQQLQINDIKVKNNKQEQKQLGRSLIIIHECIYLDE